MVVVGPTNYCLKLLPFFSGRKRMLRLASQCTLGRAILEPSGCCIRHFASVTPFPRVVGAGEPKPSTRIQPPPLPWYKQPRFIRNIVNILLLASFANSAAMILSYKSQKREISWQSKERIQTLRETIEKVRKGESIDIRAALGTGNPEMEKRWEDGMYPFHFSFRSCSIRLQRRCKRQEIYSLCWIKMEME